jgi:DNA-binding transcriptional ArsR family regulator
MIDRLITGPHRAGDLGRGLPISQPAVSRHLRVLRDAGLVSAERIGREQHYHLTPDGFRDVQRYAERTAKFWNVALHRFKEQAEARR